MRQVARAYVWERVCGRGFERKRERVRVCACVRERCGPFLVVHLFTRERVT